MDLIWICVQSQIIRVLTWVRIITLFKNIISVLISTIYLQICQIRIAIFVLGCTYN